MRVQKSLYATYSKRLDEKVAETKVERKFIPVTNYYVAIDSKLHHIRRQKDILRLLKDKRRQVAGELKSKNLKFKTHPEETLVHIVQFYNMSAQ